MPDFLQTEQTIFFGRFYSIRILFYFYRRGREGCYKVEIEVKIELSHLDNDFTDLKLSIDIIHAYNHYRSKRKLLKLLFHLNLLKIKQR